MKAQPIFIYGIFQGSKCLYVGQSKDPDSRFAGHTKDFKKCGIIPSMKIFRRASPTDVIRLESQIIRSYWRREQAKWNTSCKPKAKYANSVLKLKNKKRLSRRQWQFLEDGKKPCLHLPSVRELRSAARECLQGKQNGKFSNVAQTLLAETIHMSASYTPEIVTENPPTAWFPWVSISPALGTRIGYSKVIATKPGFILIQMLQAPQP